MGHKYMNNFLPWVFDAGESRGIFKKEISESLAENNRTYKSRKNL